MNPSNKDYIIMNSAMMPNDGTYKRKAILREDATEWLHKHPTATSYVGYQSTAEHIRHISGIQVAISRALSNLAGPTEILVVKLKYRLHPKEKGKFVPQSSDFEYIMVEYHP